MIINAKHDAIYELYTTVKSIEENADGVIVAKDQDGNEVSIDMSAVETKATELLTEIENAKQAKIDLKASAKLIAGEPLTEDEANTIVL